MTRCRVEHTYKLTNDRHEDIEIHAGSVTMSENGGLIFNDVTVNNGWLPAPALIRPWLWLAPGTWRSCMEVGSAAKEGEPSGRARPAPDRPADGWRWRWRDEESWVYQRREPTAHDFKVIEALWTAEA